MDFVKACNDGDIESTKKLLDTNKLNKGLRKACNNGHLEIAKWLNKKGAWKFTYGMFSRACTNNDIEMVKWLHSTRRFFFYKDLKMVEGHGSGKIHINVHKLFLSTLKEGSVQTIEWIFNTFRELCSPIDEYHFLSACCRNSTEIIELLIRWDFNVNNIKKPEDIFVNVCEKGYFEVAKLLHSISNVNLDTAFVAACSRGNLEIAKWLQSLGADMYATGEDNAFVSSCLNGQIETAKWLYSLGVNIQIDEEKAFQNSCLTNKLDIVKWLHSLDINILLNKPFLKSCKHNRLEIAKWIYSVGVDIHAEDDKPFITACSQNNLEIAQWLYSLGANIHAQNDNAFIEACESKKPEIAEWLLSIETDYYSERINELCKSISNIPEWIYEMYPQFLENNLLNTSNQILKKYGLSKDTLQLIESIKRYRRSKYDIYDQKGINSLDIDDILVNYLCKNNMIEEFVMISNKLPYVTVIIKGHIIEDYTIDRSQLKSARKC